VIPGNRGNTDVIPYLTVLRVVKPELYVAIRNGDVAKYKVVWDDLKQRFPGPARLPYSAHAMSVLLELALYGEKSSEKARTWLETDSRMTLLDGPIPFLKSQAGLLELEIR
jgi:hypothetical protein